MVPRAIELLTQKLVKNIPVLGFALQRRLVDTSVLTPSNHVPVWDGVRGGGGDSTRDGIRFAGFDDFLDVLGDIFRNSFLLSIVVLNGDCRDHIAVRGATVNIDLWETISQGAGVEWA